MVWRNDLDPHNREMATIDFVVITAKDHFYENPANHSLTILHVRSFHGKGFLPSVGSPFGEKGGIHLGEGMEAYYYALQEGMVLLLKAEADTANFLRKIS